MSTGNDYNDEENIDIAIALHFKQTKFQREIGIALRTPRQRQSGRIGTNREDPYRWEIILFSFLDNDQFSTLESVIVQYGVNVCYMVINDENDKGTLSIDSCRSKLPFECDHILDIKKIKLLMELQNVALNITKKSSFNTCDVESDVSRLLGKDSLAGYKSEMESPSACSSLACLVRELDLMSNSDEYGCYLLKSGDLSSHMRLDGQAMSALNLLPDKTQGGNENGNLLGVLHRGKTAMGKRLLERWIRQPCLNIEVLHQRYDMVDVFLENSTLRMELLDENLKLFPDFDRLATIFDKQKSAKLVDLVVVYDAVKGILPRILEVLSQYNGEHQDLVKHKFLDELTVIIEDFSGYLELIEEVVDLNCRPNVVINAKHDVELQRTQNEWHQVQEEIERCHSEAKEDIGPEVKCDKDKLRGYVFRITDKKAETRLSKIPGVHICQVLANGIHFTTPELKSLAKQYKELGAEYEERQAYLVKSTVNVASSYVPVLEATSRLIAELDILVGFAQAACHAGDGYCRPQLLPSATGGLKLQNARHPCVELQDDMTFIPNDYDLDYNDSRFQLLTGPNMGGKSTYIRQLGVIVVMAQIGSFVSAQVATIPIIDKILVRVGAGDAQQRGISTFMAEMLEASSILECATSSSLVIIDELGRGTSTYDGFGLAWAISDYILKKTKALCLFATHFHELTTLESTEKGVVNKHVTAKTEENDITMLYEIKEGPCLRSFGIHVARLANFPQSVIEEAKRKAKQLESFELDCAESPDKRLKRELNAHTLLKTFANLPIESMSVQQLEEEVQSLLSSTYESPV